MSMSMMSLMPMAQVARDSTAVWTMPAPHLVLEKVVRTLTVYAFLFGALRLGGRRELVQLNAFDVIVLLMLSNTLQNAIIGPDDSLVGGLIGGLVLLLTNYVVVRFFHAHRRLERLVEGDPLVLVRNGRVLEKHCRSALITTAELTAAARRQGIQSLDQVACARLEVGGSLTFVPLDPTAEERRHHEIMTRLAALEHRLERRH